MSGWWDDIGILLFKHAILLEERGRAAITRYLGFLGRAAIFAWCSTSLLVLCFVVAGAIGIQSPWLYQTLTLLMTGVLLATILVALPLLVLSQAVYEILPDELQRALLACQRRGVAILFAGFLAVVLIRMFRLWQSPATMFTVLSIVAVLWLGGSLGWLKTPDIWRKLIALKLQMALIVVAVLAMLPGSGPLAEGLAHWAGAWVEATIGRIIYPAPERWNPASAADLQFVDRGTGRHLVWYCRNEQGDYQLYKAKGYDDLGAPLKCAETEGEIAAIRNWQRARDDEREKARRAQAEAARQETIDGFEQLVTRARGHIDQHKFDDAEREAREAGDVLSQRRTSLAETDFAQRDKIARDLLAHIKTTRVEYDQAEYRRLRLASYVTSLPKTRVNYIVFFVYSDAKPSKDVTLALVSGLASKKISAAAEVFSEQFVCLEGLDKVTRGDGAADLADMGLRQVADRLLLIRGSDAKAAPASVNGVSTFAMRMTVTLIDAGNGTKLNQFVIDDLAGAGVNATNARAMFLQRFADMLAARSELTAGLK